MWRFTLSARKFIELHLCVLVSLLLALPGLASAQNYLSVFRSSGPDLVGLSRSKASCCGAKADIMGFMPVSLPQYETYKLTATYYSLRDELTTTLMLNNKGSEPILAWPTIYSLSGTRLQLATITVGAASYLDVDLHELLSGAGDEFREGSMKIAYEGGSMQLGAQVRMVDSDDDLIWAEQFVYTSKFTSSRLENVWWLPYENSKTRVAVSNTSGSAVVAAITVDGTAPHQSSPTQIALAPWETRLLDIMSDLVGHPNGNVKEKGGISITHTGNPGAVLARMFISKPDKGYSAAVSFIDPESTASQKWNGNGVRFRNLDGADLDSVLVARNNHSETSHVHGRIIYTRPDGTVQTIMIPQFNVGAGSTKLVDLDNLIVGANVPESVQFRRYRAGLRHAERYDSYLGPKRKSKRRACIPGTDV